MSLSVTAVEQEISPVLDVMAWVENNMDGISPKWTLKGGWLQKLPISCWKPCQSLGELLIISCSIQDNGKRAEAQLS